ncbi:MAG: hypothetical protein U0900_14535 [Myxococcota bacterium]
MPTRPTRLARSNRSSIRLARVAVVATAAALASIGAVRPAGAEEQASIGSKIVSTSIDVAIVRPLAAMRAGLGAVLFVPAALFASPACAVNAAKGEDCRPVFETPYEILVGEPAEYAFERKLGEL